MATSAFQQLLSPTAPFRAQALHTRIQAATHKRDRLGNRATASGGGIQAQGGSLDLAEMRFVDNKGVDGAGLAVKNGTAIINRSQFSGNVAEQRGGALLLLAALDVRLTDELSPTTAPQTVVASPPKIVPPYSAR